MHDRTTHKAVVRCTAILYIFILSSLHSLINPKHQFKYLIRHISTRLYA
nr:MAG TPA: hypothetical protein [Caudoviricetes sp.]